MPIPFEKFRFLNGTKKKIENSTFQRPLRVRVDDHPEIVVHPGMQEEIPEGAVVEVEAEELP